MIDTRLLPVLALVSVAACGPIHNEAELIATAKDSAASQLGDPSTAVFRNVRLSEKDGDDLLGTVCGEMRGKSSDGVDIDFTRFVYAPVIKQAIVAIDPRASDKEPDIAKRQAEFRAAFEDTWKESCA
jgi:hypothetical protein